MVLRSIKRNAGIGEITYSTICKVFLHQNATMCDKRVISSLSANKLKLSALRWAFFVQGRREPRSCKALHGKSPKGRQAFELQFV